MVAARPDESRTSSHDREPNDYRDFRHPRRLRCACRDGVRALALPPSRANGRRGDDRTQPRSRRCGGAARSHDRLARQGPVAAGAYRQRASRFGLASARRFPGEDQAEHSRKSAKAQRTARRHRSRAEEHHRACHPGDVAAGRARQQAVARRLRAVADGSDRPGQPAEGRLRLPTHAVEPHAPRLLRVHARQTPAGDRRQVPARRRHRLSRRQVRRRAQGRGAAAARRRRQACRRHRREVPDSWARPRSWR